MTIKEIYKSDCRVKFSHYRKGKLYYKLLMPEEVPSLGGGTGTRLETKLLFPVPIEDCGDATFNAEDKASLFIRYIKEALTQTTTE